jgi:hypothetical protein
MLGRERLELGHDGFVPFVEDVNVRLENSNVRPDLGQTNAGGSKRGSNPRDSTGMITPECLRHDIGR